MPEGDRDLATSVVRDRIEFANGLRGVAALLVVFSHFAGVYWEMREFVAGATAMLPIPPTIMPPAILTAVDKGMWPFQPGPLGVSIFFLISGFVIPFSFASFNRAQFAVSRLLRIWPTYFASFCTAVAVVALIAHYDHRSFPFRGVDVALHSIVGLRDFTGIPYIDNVLWTLEVELRFYIFAGIIGALVWRRGSAIAYLVPAALMALSVGVYVQSTAFSDQPLTSYWHGVCRYNCYVVYMFIGVALNFRYRGLQTMAVTSLAVILLASCAALLAYLYIPTLFAPIWPSYAGAIGVFLLAKHLWTPIWTWRPIRYLADVSYPLYASHSLIGFCCLNVLIDWAGWPVAISLSVTTAVVLGVAYGLHMTVEEPTKRLGRWLTNKMG